ncbi:MAG: amidohydrolase family protein [Planctomycetes bacterium]|nr:amidohydrolase family protein [Planctomycetota bacterium]
MFKKYTPCCIATSFLMVALCLGCISKHMHPGPANKLDEMLDSMNQYFVQDIQGKWHFSPGPNFPDILDIHSHMGWSYGLVGKPLNVRKSDDKVKLWYNYERDKHILNDELHPLDDEEANLFNEILSGIFILSPTNKTQTAGNLRLEMQRMGHTKACILPIVGWPLGNRNIQDTYAACDFDDNMFIPFTGANFHLVVLPWQKEMFDEDHLYGQFNYPECSAKGVKYHPEFQLAPPDSRRGLALLQWCAENQKVIIVHAGHANNLSFFTRLFAKSSSPEAFLRALKKLQVILGPPIPGNRLKIIFAHTGLEQYRDFVQVAKEYAKSPYNHDVYLATSGLDVPALNYVLNNYSREKILYGNDWGFYPISVSLARMLKATEGFTQVERHNIFRGFNS